MVSSDRHQEFECDCNQPERSKREDSLKSMRSAIEPPLEGMNVSLE
jgi:hypothetical protein